MTEQDAKAYLRFEAELMAHLLHRAKQRSEIAAQCGTPASALYIARGSYADAIADVAAFGGRVTDRFIVRKTG